MPNRAASVGIERDHATGHRGGATPAAWVACVKHFTSEERGRRGVTGHRGRSTDGDDR